MTQAVLFKDLGKDQSYKDVWDLQETILHRNSNVKAAARGLIDNESKELSEQKTTTNHLFFVEHNPVYTLGKSGDISHILISEDDRQKKGIEFFKINRGGDITFHGPGQIVGYPILDLEKFKTDLGWYLRNLEEVIIRTLAEYDLKGGRSKGETGVWLDPEVKGSERKICAMGIRCSRWITMHGFAFNVNTDLDYFNYIIPCGIQNKQVTSLQKELGHVVPMDEVKQKVRSNFEKVFEVEMEESC
ncbi:MAG: lipoyl(octanoyl) transferase LipB [Segetibacter sp.]|jgi:lipoyl(octanoyl) transferase|nr:lipoyl(octanoyl) transferase LipB [Segetibacter sp.]